VSKRPSTGNKYHAVVCALCRAHGWPEPEAEQRLIPGRKFACDLVWEAARVVCEVQGGSFVAGRHSRGVGQLRDFEKLNLLTLGGWRVLQVSPRQVTDGTLQRLLAEAFRVVAA
jgi:very-short-patch-repair endonuclease